MAHPGAARCPQEDEIGDGGGVGAVGSRPSAEERTGTRALRYRIVDVFSDRPLAGNALRRGSRLDPYPAMNWLTRAASSGPLSS